MMDVLVLGPVEVRQGGQSYRIGGAKQRALLARLVVAHGRPVSTARLCDELWPENAPRDPAHALQARISRLRTALPALNIELANGGYQLSEASFRADTVRFEELREEGCSLLAEGALAPAAARLQEALALWRGPAFADVPDIAALQAESARLDRLWESTLTDRIDIDLALGRAAVIIPELAALVEENPLAERHCGQLMTALHQSGQTQEALNVYARARTQCTERLGTGLSSELEQLHVRILREEPAESLLRHSAAQKSLSRAEIGRAAAHPLDAPLTSNSAASLAALARQHQAVIVTGPAGIGKTHVLRAVRAQLEGEHFVAPLLSASILSRSIPLGVFAGTTTSLSDTSRTPTALIDSFTRRRTSTVLLVDNVDLLDESSLFVISQLISTSRVPAILAARSLTDAPAEVQALYDSGELTEVALEKLGDVAAHELAADLTGGPLTPDTRIRILDAASGSPLHLREIVTGSLADGSLTRTDHGWELRGDPTPSPRLAQLVGARLDRLDEACLEAAALVAIAGEYPAGALDGDVRRSLARADVLALSDRGWLRLSEPIDRATVRARCSELLWHELTREAVQVLTSDLASGVPQAQRRALILALDLGDPVDVSATLALAEAALGAFDERLAVRAAEAVIRQEPADTHAHRLAAVARSTLGDFDVAGQHFGEARRLAVSEADLTDVALAHARHLGLRFHDARGALRIIEEALGQVSDPAQVPHLHRARMRWAVVAGMGGEVALPPEITDDAAAAMGLIVVGVSGVVTGPLAEAHRTLQQLRQVPEEIIDLLPGGAALISLTEIMALSYSGDVATTQLQLRQKVAEATAHSPEAIGQWEYAFGFVELFSGDARKAYEVATSAVTHLQWRDLTGLLPAAQALRAASAQALNPHSDSAQAEFEAIPEAASRDPKVVMLRGWAEATAAHASGRSEDAARTLVETAEWLLEAQHTYFAGMLAHCAMRTRHESEAAMRVLGEAHTFAGGGLLALMLRHGEATVAGDLAQLGEIAHEARELGLAATAADTWAAMVDQFPHLRVEIKQLNVAYPALQSWAT